MRPDEYVHARLLGTCLLAYVVMAVFVWLCPPAADDYVYGYGAAFSLRDILAAEVAQYFSWGGRSVAHVLARSLLMAPPVFAVLLMPLAFVGLLLFSMVLVLGETWRQSLRAWHILLLFGLFWFCIPAFGAVFFWITGAANYMWTLLFCVAFLIPLRFLYADAAFTPSAWLRGCYPVMGLLAGWSQEAIGVLAVVSAAATMALQYWRKKSVPLWLCLGGLGVVAGVIMLLAAPGNVLRMNHLDFAAYYAQSWMERLLAFISEYASVQWRMAPLYAAMLACCCILWRAQSRCAVTQWVTIVLLLLLSQGTLVVLVAAPYIPPRALTPTVFFAILALMRLMACAFPAPGRSARAIGVLCGGFLAWSMLSQGWVFWEAHGIHVEREGLLKSAEPHVVLCPYPQGNNYFFIGVETGDITEDSASLLNRAVSRVYSKESVALGPPRHMEAEASMVLHGAKYRVAAWGKGVLLVSESPSRPLGQRGQGQDIWLAHAHQPLTLRYFLQPLLSRLTEEQMRDPVEDRTALKIRFALTKCIPLEPSTDTRQWLCRIPVYAQDQESMLGLDDGTSCQYRRLDMERL